MVSHQDARGAYSQTDSIKRGINVSTRPTVLQTQALATVAGHASHLAPYSWSPRVEIIILPQTQRVDLQGNALPAPGWDMADPDASPSPYNAEDTRVDVTGYRLAYEIRTIEGREGHAEYTAAWIYHVDAQTGELLRARDASDTGTGQSFFNGSVFIHSVQNFGGLTMYDGIRNDWTFDDGYLPMSGSNVDGDDQGGNGLAFDCNGNNTLGRRQTAMVDSTFGSRVHWDLMDNVFKRQGPERARTAPRCRPCRCRRRPVPRRSPDRASCASAAVWSKTGTWFRSCRDSRCRFACWACRFRTTTWKSSTP